MLNRISRWICFSCPNYLLAKLNFESDDFWFEIINQYVGKESVVLEIGSGSGIHPQNTLRPQCAHLTGVDFDKRVLSNSNLDKAYALEPSQELTDILGGKRFDVIYSHMVAEHIEDPKKFVAQQLALLSEGGVIIHSTVSSYSIVSILNRVLPERLKHFLIEKLGSGRTGSDVFPAYYQLNSEAQLDILKQEFGLNIFSIYYDTGSGYFAQVPLLGLIYGVVQKVLCLGVEKMNGRLIFIIWKA